MGLNLPEPVEAVFRAFHTCEFATLAKDGAPIVWPTAPLYLPDRGQFLITTCIALPQKAFNIRRTPRVSLLFSNPTASGLDHPPAVLVQGDATISDEIVTWSDDLAVYWPRLHRLQPIGKLYSANVVTRWLMDWYFMRLLIYITPRAIRWWPDGDFSQAPRTVEMASTKEASDVE
ncbi:MAG TPA: pyridoxamine 5'-phosphate oxidase family protein [Ktedonobacterales bacterium]|nr:pyridoxamine 5'-phosphate oxidase family protein [Ktedonobacterales bacterium]